MNHERYGFADDSRPGQQCEAEEGKDEIDAERRKEPFEAEDGEKDGDNKIADSRREEIVAAAKVLDSVSEEELEAIGIVTAEGSREEYFSGMLPPPSIYNGYDDATKERMCRWNDAFTVDESNRQNQLVAAEIEQAKRSQAMSFALILLSWTIAAVTYVIVRDPIIPGLLLSVSILNILANLFQPVFSKSSSHKRKNDKTNVE